LSVNGQVQIATSNAAIDSNLYFVGLSGSTGQGYFQQNVIDWSFEANTINHTVAQHPQLSDVGIGSTSIVYPVYQITNGSEQSGAVYADVGDISFKFVSEFTWIGQNCSRMNSPSQGCVVGINSK
jgi:hypothetical protein